MQTFLPLPDFTESARVLDWRRLGKQRIEAKQILLALECGGAWANHPCTKMWKGYENALAAYGAAVCSEWIKRGYRDSLSSFFAWKAAVFDADRVNQPLPPWFGRESFHAAHRSALLRKDPIYYRQFGWTEPPDLPYEWE